jgi:hypothetical protein
MMYIGILSGWESEDRIVLKPVQPLNGTQWRRPTVHTTRTTTVPLNQPCIACSKCVHLLQG